MGLPPDRAMRMGKRRFFALYERLNQRSNERAADMESEEFFRAAREKRKAKW